MKIVICLDKEDIKTAPFGVNYLIQTGSIDISLTKEAANELLNDLNFMLIGSEIPPSPLPPEDRVIREGQQPKPPSIRKDEY